MYSTSKAISTLNQSMKGHFMTVIEVGLHHSNNHSRSWTYLNMAVKMNHFIYCASGLLIKRTTGKGAFKHVLKNIESFLVFSCHAI